MGSDVPLGKDSSALLASSSSGWSCSASSNGVVASSSFKLESSSEGVSEKGEWLVLRLFIGFSVFCRSGFALVADEDLVPLSVGGGFAPFAGAWPCLRFRFFVS